MFCLPQSIKNVLLSIQNDVTSNWAVLVYIIMQVLTR